MAQLGQALFVCGDQSGVGKTSVCIGLLNALSMKFSCDELAYIKPCTQCEGVQLLWKFCNVCFCFTSYILSPVRPSLDFI